MLKKSALGDYQKPMGILNQLVSHKAAAMAIVKSNIWLPDAPRQAWAFHTPFAAVCSLVLYLHQSHTP